MGKRGPKKKDTTCYGTLGDPEYCRGWVVDGHPFHGCCLENGHQFGRQRNHICKCGKEWPANRRRPVGEAD